MSKSLEEAVKEEGMLKTMTYEDLPSYSAGMEKGIEKKAMEDEILMIEKFNLKIDDVSKELKVPIEEIKTAYYLRLSVLDKMGILADVTNILSDNGINIEAIIQKEPIAGVEHVSIVMLTHKVREKQMNQAITSIEQLDGITGKVARIRLETLDS